MLLNMTNLIGYLADTNTNTTPPDTVWSGCLGL